LASNNHVSTRRCGAGYGRPPETFILHFSQPKPFTMKFKPVNMHRLEVRYGNGEKEEVELKEQFRTGGESRVIDLPGNKRVIRKVDFVYDTKKLANRKGIVELWGRH
jgi:hypothetical protein